MSRNGHLNGFGSSDEEEEEEASSSEEEDEGEEEEENQPEEDGQIRDSDINGGRRNGRKDGDDSDGEDEEYDDGGNEGESKSDDDNDDADNDSDSAPEDISFQRGKDAFEQSSELKQKQIEKRRNDIKERRRRRDEFLKEQKAAKLEKLKATKLSSNFLNSLSDKSPEEAPVSTAERDALPSSDSPSTTVELGKIKKRKLIPLPDIEGIEFEVVVKQSNADKQIMKKVDRYLKRHAMHKSIPRMSTKKKQSLNLKRSFLRRTKR